MLSQMKLYLAVIALAIAAIVGATYWNASACERLKAKCEGTQVQDFSDMFLLMQCGGHQVADKVDSMSNDRCLEILAKMK